MKPHRERCCAGCRHFNGRPLDIEAAIPGLASLSPLIAAVRPTTAFAPSMTAMSRRPACAAYASPA